MYDRPALPFEVDKRWSVSTNEGTCKRQNPEALQKLNRAYKVKE